MTILLKVLIKLALLFGQNETLIAIKAPHGTTLEVPDPDEVTSLSYLLRLISFLIPS